MYKSIKTLYSVKVYIIYIYSIYCTHCTVYIQYLYRPKMKTNPKYSIPVFKNVL